MIQIPIQELLESLEAGYNEYKKCKDAGNNEADLAHIKGFCTTIEQILNVYGEVTSEEIRKIKEPILGNISLSRKSKNETKPLDMNAIMA